jgi:hypothetical protein
MRLLQYLACARCVSVWRGLARSSKRVVVALPASIGAFAKLVGEPSLSTSGRESLRDWLRAAVFQLCLHRQRRRRRCRLVSRTERRRRRARARFSFTTLPVRLELLPRPFNTYFRSTRQRVFNAHTEPAIRFRSAPLPGTTQHTRERKEQEQPVQSKRRPPCARAPTSRPEGPPFPQAAAMHASMSAAQQQRVASSLEATTSGRAMAMSGSRSSSR